MTIKIVQELDTKISKELKKLKDKIESPLEINRDISNVVKSNTEERFFTQKSPDGKPWKKSKRAAKKGGSTLVDTGNLKNSILSDWSDKTAEVGTNVEYADVHQFGFNDKVKIKAFKRKSKSGKTSLVKAHERNLNIEKRPFLGLSAKDRKEILVTIKDLLTL